MSNKKKPIVGIALILIAGCGGFFGGAEYQKTQSSAAQSSFGAGAGGMPGGGSAQGGSGQSSAWQPMSGKIIAQDKGSITVKLSDGSTKLVIISSKLSISKSSNVDVSDLKTGEQVMVIGSSNSDGSITASSIRLGQLSGMNGAPGPGGMFGGGSNQTSSGNMNNAGNNGNAGGTGNTNNPGGPNGMGDPGAPGGMGDPGGGPGGMGGPGGGPGGPGGPGF